MSGQLRYCPICSTQMLVHPPCGGTGCEAEDCGGGYMCPACVPTPGQGWSTKTARVGFAEYKAELRGICDRVKFSPAVMAKSGKINRDGVCDGWHVGLELDLTGRLRGAAECEAKGVFVKLPP